MNVPMYGTKQAAYCFFKTFAKQVKNKKYQQSKADPCLYYVWIGTELVVMVAWVDDVMILGTPELVDKVQRDLESVFTCKHKGELSENVGSKIMIQHDEDGMGTVKFTQPVLIQKLEDEYELTGGSASRLPAMAGQVLIKGDGTGIVDREWVKRYRSATATCMFIMQWSRPDVYNAVRSLARHMNAPQEAHLQALTTLMKYMVSTRNWGLVLAPKALWD